MSFKLSHSFFLAAAFLSWTVFANILQVQTSSAAVLFQIKVQETTGSTTKLEELLVAVGSEFFPAPELAERLQEIGIKRLRLINVDCGDTRMVEGHLQGARIDMDLNWCNVIGAQPYRSLFQTRYPGARILRHWQPPEFD